jgi:hypothetical protein
MMEIDCDVLIYGGTSGAVGTAVEGARLGLRILMISPSEHIGKLPLEYL